MKKIFLLMAVLFGSFLSKPADAQVRLGVNINIGSQPVWGPVGYDRADYYYMPDIDAFYSIPNRQYIYEDGGRWIFSNSLPGRYRNYDLNRGYKVVINDDRPYLNAPRYRSQYAGYKNNYTQQIIRNSHEEKYFEIKNHPEHNKWKGNNGNNGNGRGNGKGDRDDDKDDKGKGHNKKGKDKDH